MFDVSSLADTGADWLGKANALLNQGAQAYKTVTGVTNPPQSAPDVAAGKPVKQPFNWKPLAIIGGVLALLGIGWLATRKK